LLEGFWGEEEAVEFGVFDVGEFRFLEVLEHEGPEGFVAFAFEGEGAFFAEGHFFQVFFADLDDIDARRGEVCEGEFFDAVGGVGCGFFEGLHGATGGEEEGEDEGGKEEFGHGFGRFVLGGIWRKKGGCRAEVYVTLFCKEGESRR
jgi:hypothetical protein